MDPSPAPVGASAEVMIKNFISRQTTRSSWERGRIAPTGRVSRFLEWLVKVLGREVQTQVSRTDVKFYSVDLQKVSDLATHLLQLEENRMVRPGEIERIIVGRDWMEKLLEEPCNSAFGLQARVGYRTYETGTTFFNVPVQFLPWIEGVVVVPKWMEV